MKSHDGNLDPERMFDFPAGQVGGRNKPVKASPNAIEPIVGKIKPKGTRFQSQDR